jgi:hypothetical protein
MIEVCRRLISPALTLIVADGISSGRRTPTRRRSLHKLGCCSPHAKDRRHVYAQRRSPGHAHADVARVITYARGATAHAAIKPATKQIERTTSLVCAGFAAARSALRPGQIRAADPRWSAPLIARRRTSGPKRFVRCRRRHASAAIELARSLRYTGTDLSRGDGPLGAIRPALASTSARLPKRVADQGFIDAFDF